jgi:phage terminase small subunit
MAILPNPKHELFAQGLAVGKTQERAYINAGYSAGSPRANSNSLIKANQSISERVAELQAGGAIRAEVTIADLVQELESARLSARDADIVQASAMVAATMAKAKLLGLIVDKREVKNYISHEDALAALND